MFKTRRRQSDAWEQLQAKYRGHPALAPDAVYSLPHTLLDLVCRDLPRLLEKSDEQFERDLTESAAVGYFREQPISYAPLTPPDAALRDAERRDRMGAQLRQIMEHYLSEQGASPQLIEDYYTSEDQERMLVEEWRWSYAGWLATSADFRQDCRLLRANLHERNGKDLLPAVEATMTGRSDEPANPDEFRFLWLPFFRRWALERLATWDLPVPMRPHLSSSSLYDFADVAEGGMLLFVPWYLLRHRGFDLYSLADRKGLAHVPTGLAKWLNPKKKNWGSKRYLMMLRMYTYLALSLKARYAQRLRGQYSRLDEVFANFFSIWSGEQVTGETIRKIRQEMNRRMSN